LRSAACSSAVSGGASSRDGLRHVGGSVGGSFQASDCDALWSKRQAARSKTQTYTIERVESLSNEEIAELPDDPEEQRLHARVDRAYEAWQAAGCGR
jgi:hypothetical protein